jgi:GGDEF domain-containing protein
MMDFWLIEILCFGAEVTVALLLIAFAWKPPAAAVDEEHVGVVDWEPAKRTFTQFWLHRGLYLQRWRKEQKPKTDEEGDDANEQTALGTPHVLSTEDVQIYLQLIPEPWRDRLTSLVNRQGFDTVLNAWSGISADHRAVSCVSLFSLNDYSTLISNHGAMTIEQALREVATYLSGTMAHTCLVARYQPDRFAILHFSDSLADCHYQMEDVQAHITGDDFIRINDQPLSMRCVVSIVDLLEDIDLVTQMDALEEGSLVAADNDAKVVSQVGTDWVETPPERDGDLIRRRPDPSESDLDLTNTRQSQSSDFDSSETDESEVSTKDTIDDDYGDDEQPEEVDEELSTQDISAVASAADIEALFAQINSKKQGGASGEVPSPSEAVNASGDEASLESIDSEASDETPDLSPDLEPKSDPVSPISDTAAAPELDTNAAVSNDDIAALFASVQNTAKPKSSEPSSPPKVEPADGEVASKATESAPTSATPKASLDAIDLNEAATADDIASLFETVKAAKKTAPAETKPATKETAPAAKPSLDAIDLNESATADDIASLFETVKAAAKTAPVETKPATNEMAPAAKPSLDAIDLNGSATADDIASLFATVNATATQSQGEAKSAPEGTMQATVSDPVAADEPSVDLEPTSHETVTEKSAIPTGDELFESASPDDIASLFAALRK